jgi:hypothetical protein
MVDKNMMSNTTEDACSKFLLLVSLTTAKYKTKQRINHIFQLPLFGGTDFICFNNGKSRTVFISVKLTVLVNPESFKVG